MEHSCGACGQPVEDGIAFCRHCGSPQIRVAPAEIQAAAVDSAPGSAHLPASGAPARSDLSQNAPSAVIRWRDGLPAAAMAGLPAAFGMLLVGLFAFWMLAAGFLSVALYHRRTRGEGLLPRAGARLGALTGAVGFSIFALITVPTGIFRAMMLEMIHRFAQRSDPQMRALTDTWVELLKTSSGVAIWLICMFVALVMASALGGALGGWFIGRGARG
jgi:hypothetical protein